MATTTPTPTRSTCSFCAITYTMVEHHLKTCPKREVQDCSISNKIINKKDRAGKEKCPTTQPPMRSATSKKCPFCDRDYRGLGNHLAHCNERRERDYTPYLSQTTIKKKKSTKGKKKCPKCGKSFRRLDTHLKNSAFCKTIQNVQQHYLQEQCQMYQDSPPLTEHSPNQKHQPQRSAAKVKQVLSLPKASDTEAWLAADTHFRNNLLPTINDLQTPDEINEILICTIYSYFATTHGTKAVQKDGEWKNQRVKQDARPLKKVTELKNKARKEFRDAKRNGLCPVVITNVARNFFKLIREHNKVKKKTSQDRAMLTRKQLRRACHINFWKFAKDLLDDNSASSTKPQFGADKAEAFFGTTYRAVSHNFSKPSWMPTPQLPSVEFNDSQISPEEIQYTIKHAKSQSSPSPLDRISYQIFKKCPSLYPALLLLFQRCWSTGIVPTAWKQASIKLMATRYLKKWTGLTRSANVSLLYITKKNGGLGLHSLTLLYKSLQTSKQCQLLTSSDATVRHIAEKNLQTETKQVRKSFKPAVQVQESMKDDPGTTRKALRAMVKRKIR